MYKCYKCNFIFKNPDTEYEEPNLVPAPFGSGYVEEGGGYLDCCPNCGSDWFEDFDYDGEHCPHCNQAIDFNTLENFIMFIDEDNFECRCTKCQKELKVSKGEFDYE